MALPEGHVDHRRLDVLVPHRLLDGEGAVSGLSHLRAEEVEELNSQDA